MEDRALSPDMIAEIYAAAIDEDGWQNFATILAKATAAETVGVWLVDQGRVVEMSMTADSLETIAPYTEHFHALDPWQAGLARSPRDRVLLGSEHTPEDRLLKTEFYNDFGRPLGLFRPMGLMMQLAPGMIASIGLERRYSKKLFEVHDKKPFERVAPHVKRALQLRLRHRARAPQSALRGAALDALAFGVLVCDAGGGILFANAEAEALAHRGAGIVLSGRQRGVSALVPAEARVLAACIRNAASGRPGGVVRLSGSDGATALVVLVTPLPRGLGGNDGPGRALVALRPVWDSPAFNETMLAALFGLSPTQAAITLDIFNGKSPDTIAAERGVRISTLRTHLAQIFSRTGAETQRDLVRLLATLPPLRRPPSEG